ncbi:hypothetical protein [Aquisediminimonas sediminicola]|uniref:hypothetical protein n=1 Tax=Alteraquisediminimonas sediminicola TaxID=2676787 RepID=UPI001C8E75AF|nr:hypothetical protein [Aquisediminimonas sediminicola]
MSNRVETGNIGQTNGRMRRRSLLARLVPLLGLAVGALAAVAVLRAPAWLIEQLVIEARLGDYIPAAQPPLGMNARIALALCMGIAGTACTWLTLKWLFVPKNRTQWPVATASTPMARDLHIADEPPAILKEKQQVGSAGLMGLLRRRQPATSQVAPAEATEDMPIRRRRPILAASELGPPLDDIDPQAVGEWHPAEEVPTAYVQPEYTQPAYVPSEYAPVESLPPEYAPVSVGLDESVLDLGPMILSPAVEPAPHAVEMTIMASSESVEQGVESQVIIATDEMPAAAISSLHPRPSPHENFPMGMRSREALDAATMPLDALIDGLNGV